MKKLFGVRSDGQKAYLYTITGGGICPETQFFPDAVNHPEWKQPITKAGERYHSVTKYCFC